MLRLNLAVIFLLGMCAYAKAQVAINGVAAQSVPVAVQKSDVFAATTGFTRTVPDGVTIEVINAAALLATGTITLPANPTDGMPLTIEAPKGVTLVTFSANTGQSLVSGLTLPVMTAGVPYRFKYSGVNSTWYPN